MKTLALKSVVYVIELPLMICFVLGLLLLLALPNDRLWPY